MMRLRTWTHLAVAAARRAEADAGADAESAAGVEEHLRGKMAVSLPAPRRPADMRAAEAAAVEGVEAAAVRDEVGGGRGGRGGRGAGAAQLGTSPYGRSSGGFSGGGFTPGGTGGGTGGGGRGGAAHRTPGSAGRGGASGGGSAHKAAPTIYGLANQFLFVELESDGVWKVSVPNGQRFSKAFLAGLEVWARQVLAGEEPVLQRSVAPAARTQAATPSSAAAAAAAPSSTGRVPSFIPPPPPSGGSSGAGAHPIASLTGSGLPGLDTIAKGGSGANGRAAVPNLIPPPPAATLSNGGANPAADGALDFVSLLQAQMGMGGGSGGGSAGVGANFAAPGSAAAEGKYTGSVRVDGSGVAAAAESPETPVAAAAVEAASAAAGEYRGLMAAVEEEMAAAGPVSYNPFAVDDAEEEEEEEEEEEDAEEVDQTAEDELEEDGDEYGVEEGEDEDEAYLDNYDEERDDYEEGEEGEAEGEEDDEDEDEDEEDEDDSSYDEAAEAYLADLEEQDMHLGDPDRRATTPSAAVPATAGKAGGRPAAPPLAVTKAGGSSAAAYPSFIPPPPLAASAVTPPPPPPPPAPIAHAAAAAAASPVLAAPAAAVASGARAVGSVPLSLGLLRQLRSLDEGGRLRVSLRLERQSLNDTELEMVAEWYSERAASLLVPAKLWLFDNRISDAGAAAVARSLLHPALQELHLSHNFIGDKGAAALAAALPVQRPAGMRPLWLRLEWNVLSVDALRERLDEQAAARGLVTDIPRIEPTGKPMGRGQAGGGSGSGGGFAPGHELKLVLQRGVAASVQLPWVTCQKQAPSEAEVLRAVKGFYRDRAPEPATAAAATSMTAPKPPLAPVPTPPSKPKPATPAAPITPPPPPVLPEPQPGDERFRPGPLLLFPDTSALLTMLGGNHADRAHHGASPPLDWGLLLELAAEGRFGRSLPPEEQVFIVVADSVMKQLDGLKSSVDACAAIRRFMRDGLEQAGPAGYDFLTLLGSHEGEGLALEAGGLEGLAGSRSAAVSSRGQAVDMKIVEVALFFQAEVARAIEPAAEGGPSTPAASASCLPVMLLSNDNGQIAGAKSHGLPAFRLSTATDLAAQLAALRNSGGALTATLLRRLLAPQATKGLGSTAKRSVQEHFDGAVGTLRGVVDVLGALAAPLEQITRLAQTPEDAGSATAALAQIRELLGTAGGGGGLAAGVSALLSGLQTELASWEGILRSHQAPSRVVQWAALTPSSQK
ncbi:hypothetical protein HYH02_000362 [Chlamydomonas schloesseri]|uniref:Uncharacterized protein n=1 Tax=Chlamydomonas schloesseri TaxID=2026947 RepID=A0A835WY89_9CHLO|nr:hypothetical protein HYH02_000362 [Chlamydomonas schloesseri]|eukprot:KAG2454515.1 hypothetical protein HYH02_000362 [Chlamydomonas schloesseri]